MGIISVWNDQTIPSSVNHVLELRDLYGKSSKFNLQTLSKKNFKKKCAFRFLNIFFIAIRTYL